MTLAPRLLVVDDDRAFRLTTSALLKASGYRVDVAADSREAGDMLQTSRYDLMILDLRMPVMDGFETTRRIRHIERGRRRTPILALTASAMEDDQRRCREAGMDAFLTKPVRIGEIQRALERLNPLEAVAPGGN